MRQKDSSDNVEDPRKYANYSQVVSTYRVDVQFDSIIKNAQKPGDTWPTLSSHYLCVPNFRLVSRSQIDFSLHAMRDIAFVHLECLSYFTWPIDDKKSIIDKNNRVIWERILWKNNNSTESVNLLPVKVSYFTIFEFLISGRK